MPDAANEPGGENRFEAALADLSDTQRAFADTTLEIAKRTFASFKDAEESHYFCAPGRTPEETWREITAEVARVTAILASEAERGGKLVASDVHRIHRGIFAPAFGDATLEMRRHREQVTYGIVLGTPDAPRHATQTGKSAKGLERSLKENLGSLKKAVDARDRAVRRGKQREVLDATLPAAACYGKFLADHPYVDGNGRTAFPLLTFALIRLGLVAVAMPETQRFHWALGRAMQRSNRDPEPLGLYLKDLVVSSDTRDTP